jgi:galactokinase
VDVADRGIARMSAAGYGAGDAATSTADRLAEQRDRVTAAFAGLTGRQPAGVWAAPGRVNVIGEHTDYNDGFVLPMAIDRQVVVAAAPRDDGVLRVRSLQQPAAAPEPVEVDVAGLAPGSISGSGSGSGSGWAAYPAGMAWVLREAGHAVGGVDLVLSGTVPVGSGLSSSAALECAAGLALAGVHGIDLAPAELARLAQRDENVFVGVPCGAMDQLASSYGRAGHVLFIDIRDLAVRPQPFDAAGAGLGLLVLNTRVQHQLGDSAYADRRAACESAAGVLGVAALRDLAEDDLPAALDRLDPARARRVRHVVTENARVLAVVSALAGGRISEIGPLLTASHISLRDDYEVSCAELDTAVDAALAAGALGARMTGGGFGGCAIALVPLEQADMVADAVGGAFAQAGFREPEVFPAVASGGAARL